MKFATVSHDGRQVPVLQTDEGSIDLHAALADLHERAALPYDARSPHSLHDLIGLGEPMLAFARLAAGSPERKAWMLPTDGSTKPLAPIPWTARNVFCVGRNYKEHIQEDNVSRDKATPLPEVPQFFTKPATSIVGDGASVRLDEKVTKRLDYEVELAIVIGKAGRDIAPEHALAHVFGYTIVNDVTARDLQRRHDQWFKGKGLDTFCPMGPCIVTADEIPDPQALRIQMWVNDEARQDGTTADMIFSVVDIIVSLSAGLTLLPGDVIATGTPSGVGYAMNPRRYLAVGDRMRCRLEKVGELANAVVGP